MGKSSLFHDRDGIAIDALRTVLPKYWIYKNPGNIFGGKEYSEDLIIEVVNDDALFTVTGIEFGVQNKTDVEIRKHFVTVKLQTSDVHRLMGLMRPALIHAHHVATKTSYWIWLNEWYSKNQTKLKKDNVVIRIPKTQVLNESAVASIKSYATWDYHKRQAAQMARIIANQHKNDYAVRVITTESSITTIIDPKHDGAVPRLVPLDAEAMQSVEKAYQMGTMLRLSGEFAIYNFPELISKDMLTDVEAWVFPTSPMQKRPLRIEFLDGNDRILFKTPHVIVECIRPGTVLSVWQGDSVTQKVTYKMEFNRVEQTANFIVNFHVPSWTAKSVYELLTLLDQLRTCTRIHITNLETEEDWFHNGQQLFSADVPLKMQILHRIVKGISVIEEKLGMSFPIPPEVTNTILETIEQIAEIVTDGAILIDSADIVPKGTSVFSQVDIPQAKLMLAQWERGESIGIYFVGSRAKVETEVLGKNVDLGVAQYGFANIQLLNLEEMKTRLEVADVADDRPIPIVFDIDREQVYLQFLNWLPS
ncbi:MAG: DUF4365 domain-containing protein [Chloroflexi bacterium]|uniref:DUF4365 domain-containing protein n=1 Tax=Candidatus Flexifilum breve TaxID=3140694 RepID=UPI0031374D30|nr:DUF4365 domain-containing protein [Chloroflexota bacterium]